MAITINTGSAPVRQTINRITYRDLHLDLTEQEAPKSQTLYGTGTNIDLKTSVDEGAIMNSLRNLFNTTPGQKLLDPEYGLNLSEWLFEPASEQVARSIGETIQQGVTRYEPRVLIDHIDIVVVPEQNQYEIELIMTIPSLNIISKAYKAILEQPGFDFLQSTN